MELTQKEQRMVARLRKQERRWRWGRWLMLSSGVFHAAVAVVTSCVFLPQIQAESDMANAAFELAVVFPLVLVFSANATLFLCLAIRDWHGNTTRMLLLKLLETSSKRN